jgi:membrane protein
MIKKWLGKFEHALVFVRDFLDEKTFATFHVAPLSRAQRFAHFCLLVGKGFSSNRCPMRASALAYTSLLALIPMLFVVISVSSTILRKDGGQRVNHFVDHLLVSMTPPVAGGGHGAATGTSEGLPKAGENAINGVNVTTNNPAVVTVPDEAIAPEPKTLADRDELIRLINRFVKNIQSGTLGVTSVVALIFMAISMLGTIEGTFNDIWRVPQGRGWLVRIEKYCAVLFMGPLLLGVAVGLSSEPYFQTTREILHTMPFLSRVLFHILPAVLLCLSFAVVYRLIPNTHVHWNAAIVGGFVGGVLWQLNNYFSFLYVSRWVTNSKIYGSLAAAPVFMVGVYVSWLIVLFGAQVAYAFQNRAEYLQEKQARNINQRGREFIALRLMECVGQRFQRGENPATVAQMAEALTVPACLVGEIMETLAAARLVVAITGEDPAFAPARPLENITCHDILLALRAGQGQELATRDDPARAEVFGEFERILEAEKKAAAAVSILAMVNRTEKLAGPTGHRMKAVTDGKK